MPDYFKQITRENRDHLTRLPVDIRLRRILLVDGDNAARSAVIAMLSDLSFQHIREATNGAEALDALANSEVPIDLIVTEIDMAVMDGFDFIDRVRLGMRAPDPNVPIIVMSARSDSETLQRLKKLKINGFVTKPLTARNIFERIVQALQSAKPPRKRDEQAVRKLP